MGTDSTNRIARLDADEMTLHLMAEWVRRHKPCGPELLAGIVYLCVTWADPRARK